MTLDELNSVEADLSTEIKNTFGLIEEKTEQLRQRGIFERYSEVFKRYSALIDCQSEGTEALKRAVFLKWYESAEPSFLSGVDWLPESTGQKVLKKLNDKIKNKDLDYEFQWMLSHYILVIDIVFFDLADIRNFTIIKNADIRNFTIIKNKEIWEDTNYDLLQFENRGQMGNYWTDVISGSMERLNFREKKQKNENKNSEK